MRFFELKVIVGMISLAVVHFSNLGAADDVKGRSGDGQLIILAEQKLDDKPALKTIKELVRQPFPSPLTFQYFEKIKSFAQNQNTIPELMKLLRDGCKGKNIDEHLCSNIVTTLGVLATPEALTGIREFLEQGSQESDLRVKTDAIRSLGVWVNIRNQILKGQDENAKEHGDLIKGVLESLVVQASEGVEKTDTSESQNILQPPSHVDGIAESSKNKSGAFSENLLKNLEKIDQIKWARRLRRAALQGLAFSGSKQFGQIENGIKDIEVKTYLESLLAQAEVGTSFRAFMLEILTAHNIIAKVGVECYFEQRNDQERSDECNAQWAGKEKFVSQKKPGS